MTKRVQVGLVRWRFEALISGLLIMCGLLLGCVWGLAAYGGSTVEPAGTALLPELWLHNSALLLLTVAGGLTLGLSTTFMVIPTWFVVGAQIGTAAVHIGWSEVAAGLVAHLVPELLGFTVATMVSLIPAGWCVRRARGDLLPIRVMLADALILTVFATFLISVAAILEVSITPRLIS